MRSHCRSGRAGCDLCSNTRQQDIADITYEEFLEAEMCSDEEWARRVAKAKERLALVRR